LLHLAGTDVQDIFSTLPNTGEANDFAACIVALNTYFVPQINIPYARQLFQSAEPEPSETFQQFSTRLRKLAADCNYGNDTDNHIRDALLWRCTQPYIKRRLLEEGDGLTLARTLTLAAQCEKIEIQMKAEETTDGAVHAVRETVSNYKVNKYEQGSCYRCGIRGHYARDPSCPARGKQCNRCHQIGHFEKMCKTKEVYPRSTDTSNTRSRQTRGVRHTSDRQQTRQKSYYVNTETDRVNDDGDEYSFGINVDRNSSLHWGNSCRDVYRLGVHMQFN